MSSDLQIINPLDIPAWDEMVLQTDVYSIFHSQAWARVLVDTYGYRPVYLVQIESGKLQVLVPVMIVRSWLTGTRGVSLPFSDACDLLLGETGQPEPIIEYVRGRDEFSGCRYLEFRSNLYENGRQPPYTTFYSHRIDLGVPAGELLKMLHRSHRRNVRAAQKKNIRIVFGNSYTHLQKYFRLHTNTRRRQGYPPQPFKFFDNIHRHLIARNRGHIVLAFHGGICIAGAVFLHYGQRAVYKFGASLTRYHSLRANNLIMWEAIKHYQEQGYQEIFLGRTEMENRGLLRYKNGWGSQPEPLPYYRFNVPDGRALAAADGQYLKSWPVFKLMPLPLLRLSGKIAYKHIG